MDTNNSPAKVNAYYNEDELLKQHKLWTDAEKKHPWYDAPPKVKVTTEKGICHMKIKFTVGLPPEGVYDLLTNPNNQHFFHVDKGWRSLLAYKSRKVLKEDGPRQITKVERSVDWEFLWWSGYLPISLIVDENKKDLTAKYKKEKMMFMKVFKGSYKVEPLYVDSQRLCNNTIPNTREEYQRCSGGQGKIASKVTMDQYFQPYPLVNLPPFSWHIHRIIINTTTTLLKMLQERATIIREVH